MPFTFHDMSFIVLLFFIESVKIHFLAGCTQPKAGGEVGSGVKAQKPVVFADVPDVAMVRVGEVYYMASTTMHMNPGLPIMKSTDLVNWVLVSYAYDHLVDNPQMNLEDGANAYGAGSWAPSIRYHEGLFSFATAETGGYADFDYYRVSE